MIDNCIKCGACYNSCFIEELGLISFVSYTFNNDKDGLWTCCNCWTCQDGCPQNIPLMQLKWDLQRCEVTPPALLASFNNIELCGYCLPVDEEDINAFRTDIGLDPITIAPDGIITLLLNSK